MKKGIGLVTLLLVSVASVNAQTVAADRLRLNVPSTAGCTARAGNGSPVDVVNGNRCDTYEDLSTGLIYKKISSTLAAGWYPVVGPSGATCTTFEGCIASRLTTDFSSWTQALRTDSEYKMRSYVNTDGGHIQSYHPSGWRPLILSGGPVRIAGGGLNVGGAGVADPGLGNANINGYIGKPGYVSQLTGWRIDGMGAADFRYLFTDELHARKFVADLEQALAGLQIIAKSVGMVGADFTVPAAGDASTLIMKDLPSADDMAIFESGDYVWLRSFERASGSLTIADAFGIVTSYTDLDDGLQSWTFTRLATDSGSLAGGSVISEDSIVLDLGVPGNGAVETNAIDGIYGINSPYTQVWTWDGASPFSGNRTLRTRTGNLRGVTGVTDEYGIIAGTYAATGGQYARISSEAAELHGLNFSMWDSTTKVFEINRTAPSLALGNPMPSNFETGTGVWMGKSSGVYKMHVGNPSGQYMSWDGTNLEVIGSITVMGGNAATTTAVSAAETNAINTAAADATTKANAAIAAASSDATSKANAAEAAAKLASLDKLTYLDTTTIKGGMITTGSVTAAQIAANTITAAKIAAGTITATEIAASTITGAKIAAGTITASNIAAGTITATQISAGTVTADRLNISSLSAISANLGTVTAGSISGVTAVFGGTVTLDSDGIELAQGTSSSNQVKWTDGTYFLSNSGVGNIQSSGHFVLASGGQITLTASSGVLVTGGLTAGTTALGNTTFSGSIVAGGQTGQTTSFGVNDSGCSGSNRRSMFFQNGILYASPCQ